MVSQFIQFIDAWNDPSMRHAMVVHFPIVLSLVGLPFAVIAALWGPRSRMLRSIALAMYLAFTVSALVARNAGHEAEEAVEGSLDDKTQEELEEHEHHGHNLWFWPAGITILLGASLVNHRYVRLPSAWLAVAVGLVAAQRVAETADEGGRLVYEHSVGTPGLSLDLLIAEASEPADDPRIDFFRREVRPILAANCWRCHNSKRRAANLDQTTIAGLLDGGTSGPAIVPGQPDESLLIKAVRWEIPDLEMPMGAEETLPDDVIAKLERWIREGAVWEAIEPAAAEEE